MRARLIDIPCERGRKWPIRTIDDMGHRQKEPAVAPPCDRALLPSIQPTNTHTIFRHFPRLGVRVHLMQAAPLWAPPNSAGVRYVQTPPRVTSCACRKASPACATAPTNWNGGP